MYVADQSSKSRSRSGVLNKEKTPGEFTINPDPITIYRHRLVFEPNPSQQGLKLARSRRELLSAVKVFEPNPSQQGLKPDRVKVDTFRYAGL